jgi:hypothetical protein
MRSVVFTGAMTIIAARVPVTLGAARSRWFASTAPTWTCELMPK